MALVLVLVLVLVLPPAVEASRKKITTGNNAHPLIMTPVRVKHPRLRMAL